MSIITQAQYDRLPVLSYTRRHPIPRAKLARIKRYAENMQRDQAEQEQSE